MSSRAYVDTLGIAIPQVKSTLGQASFGPEVAYRYSVRDGSMLEPYVSLQGIWSFAGNATDVVAGTPVGPDELRGKVEVGIKAVAPSGLILDLSSSYDGVGSGSYAGHLRQGHRARAAQLARAAVVLRQRLRSAGARCHIMVSLRNFVPR